MTKINKKLVIPLLIAALLLISAYILRIYPVKSIYYETSTACNSNLYGGGQREYIEYRIIGGGLAEYNSKKAQLESLNIPQDDCDGASMAPVDVSVIKLFVF
jgi:hypothetical protein